MELRQLALFVAVAEEGGFTRAAEREHIVQSGISASVATLERELGVDLFLRLPRGVELTPAGAALLIEARRVLAAATSAVAAAKASSGSLTGSLTVAMIAGATLGIPIARAVRDYRLANPNVTVRIQEKSSRAFQELRAGQCDVFISPGPVPPGIASIPLAEWPIVLACPESHRFARESIVDIASIAGEPLIDVPSSVATRAIVDAAFTNAGVERRTVAEARGPLLMMSLIREGIGLAFVPAVWGAHSRGIRYVQVRPEIGAWQLAACYIGETGLSPVADAFVEVLLSAIAEQDGVALTSMISLRA